MKAVRVMQFGGPEVLETVDAAPPAAREGHVVVEVTAAGVNYMDTYARSGRPGYAGTPPFIPGAEGAGRVLEVGPGVTSTHGGERVVWKNAPGSYAARVAVPAAELVSIPAEVSEEDAAAVFLQGLTAHYLLHSTYAVQPGDLIVVHAAAGGVGLLLTQMAVALGARVVGTVSNAEKEQLAREAGAEEVVRSDHASVSEVVREVSRGEGAAAVYDGVGMATFDESLHCLRPRGVLAVFGAASGPVPPFDIQRLMAAGSLFLTRPTLAHYYRNRAELLHCAGELFDQVVSGALRVHINRRYTLEEAGQAHRDLESRATVGKLLLVP